MSQDGDLVLTCGADPSPCMCRLHSKARRFSLKCFNFKPITDTAKAFRKPTGDDLRSLHFRRKLAVKRAQKYASRRRNQEVKLRLWGTDSLQSPNKRYQLSVNKGAYYAFLEIEDKKDRKRYPIYTVTPGAHGSKTWYGVGWYQSFEKCILEHKDRLTPLCVRKALWRDDRLTVIIGVFDYCGIKDYVFEIALGDLSSINWKTINAAYLKGARAAVLAPSTEKMRIRLAEGVAFGICPWSEHPYFNPKWNQRTFRRTCIQEPGHYYAMSQRFGKVPPKRLAHMIKALVNHVDNDYSSFSMFRPVKNKQERIALVKEMRGNAIRYIGDLLDALSDQLPEPTAEKAGRWLKKSALQAVLKRFNAMDVFKRFSERLENPTLAPR